MKIAWIGAMPTRPHFQSHPSPWLVKYHEIPRFRWFNHHFSPFLAEIIDFSWTLLRSFRPPAWAPPVPGRVWVPRHRSARWEPLGSLRPDGLGQKPWCYNAHAHAKPWDYDCYYCPLHLCTCIRCCEMRLMLGYEIRTVIGNTAWRSESFRVNLRHVSVKHQNKEIERTDARIPKDAIRKVPRQRWSIWLTLVGCHEKNAGKFWPRKLARRRLAPCTRPCRWQNNSRRDRCWEFLGQTVWSLYKG